MNQVKKIEDALSLLQSMVSDPAAGEGILGDLSKHQGPGADVLAGTDSLTTMMNRSYLRNYNGRGPAKSADQKGAR
jgi:hypothetical protein